MAISRTLTAFALLGCIALGAAQDLPGIALSDGVAYAPMPSGGVQAIDIRDGSIIWQNSNVRWPLAHGSGKLVALGPLARNISTVAFLNSATGKIIAQVGPVEFPGWAPVRFDYVRPDDAKFRIWTQSLGPNNAFFLWRAEAWPRPDFTRITKAQNKLMSSGRIAVTFSNNAVQSVVGPVSVPTPQYRPDYELPLLKGQKAIASAPINAQSTLAIISTGRDVYLMHFRERILRWSCKIATSRR